MPNRAKDLVFVTIQLVLFLLYIFNISMGNIELGDFAIYSGLSAAIIGSLIIVFSILQLSTNLSIFPTPKPDSNLVTVGLFKYMRHPIYTGIIVASFGLGMYFLSLYKIIISLALLILFYFKSKHEESMLKEKFPDYNTYMNFAGRFFPKNF